MNISVVSHSRARLLLHVSLTALLSAAFTLSQVEQASAVGFPYTGGASSASTTGSVNTVGLDGSTVISQPGSAWADGGANNELDLAMAGGAVNGSGTVSNLRADSLTIDNTASSTNHAAVFTTFGKGRNGSSDEQYVTLFLTGTNSLTDDEAPTLSGGRGAALYGLQTDTTGTNSGNIAIDSLGDTKTTFTGNNGIYLNQMGGSATILTGANDVFNAISGATGDAVHLDMVNYGNAFAYIQGTINAGFQHGIYINNNAGGFTVLGSTAAITSTDSAIYAQTNSGSIRLGLNPTIAADIPTAWNDFSGLSGAMTSGAAAQAVVYATSPGQIQIVTASTGTVDGGMNGIEAAITASGGNTINITAGGAVGGTTAPTSAGVYTSNAGSGTVTITANANVTGVLYGIELNQAGNAASSITVASGTTVTGATDGILTTGSGAATLSISGKVAGNILTGGGNDAITLTSSATATDGVVTGTIDGGAGTNSLTLAGTSTTAGQDISKLSNISSITKADSGTWTITGTSAIDPSWTISAGTLQLGNGGTSGTLGSGAITDDTALVLNRSDSYTVANSISGTGDLTVADGTATLTGSSSYSGTTTISTGATLKVGAAGALSASSTLAGAGTLDLNGNSATIDDLNWSGTVDNSAAGTATLTTGTATNTSFGGVVEDTGGTLGLTKAGTGTLSLSGRNTYTGTTTISAGTLALSGSGSIASSSVADDGTFDISATTSGTSIKSLSGSGTVTLGDKTLTLINASDTFSGSIGGTGGLNISGSQTLSGNNGYTGTTAIDSGTLSLSGGGSIASSSGVADDGTLDISGTTSGASIKNLSGSGTVALGGQTLTLTSATGTFSGSINGTGGLTISGSQTLSGSNTYSGATTISSGTLALSGSGSIASSSVADSGTFDISGTTSGGAGIKSLSGNGVVTLGAKTLTLTSATGTFSGGIGGSGGLTVGGGTATLSSSNGYSGATTISSGTLSLSGSGSIAASSGVADSGTFDISGTTSGASIKSLGGSGTVTLGGQTLTITSASGTFSGGIGGTGGLTISGNQTLSGSNGFTGATTISSGTLSLSGSGSIAASSGVADSGTFDISGATSGASIKGLSGSGAVTLGAKTLTLTSATGTFSGTIGGSGGLTISGNQTLSGNNSFTGATTISSGTLALSGSIASSSGVADSGTFDISGTTSGASIKSLSGSGAVTLGGKTLTITSAAGTFSGTISGSGGLAIAGGSETLTRSNSYSGGTTVSGTLILGTSGAAGTGTITTTGSVVGYADGVTIANAIDINSNTTQLQVTAGTATQVGAITETAGPRGLEKTGAGTLILTGNNSFTGATTISAGILSLSGSGSIAASSGVADSGAFDISATTSGVSIASLSGNGTVALGAETLVITSASGTFSGSIGGTGGLTVGGGTATLSGRNNYSGVTTIDGGANLTLSGSIASSSGVADSGTFDISGTTSGASIKSLSGNGTVTLGSKTLTLTSAAGTFSGGIDGTGGLTVGGGTATLSGSNSYSGTTTISSGTLALSGSGSIASSSDVADSGTFDISGTTGGASIKSLSGSGTVTLGGQTLTLTSASGTFSGGIGGTGGLAISGNQTLSGSNSFTGATTISAGTLSLSGSGGIAASSGVADSGTFDISGTTSGASIKSLSGNGVVTLGGKILTLTSDAGTFSGGIGGTGGLTVRGGTATLSGSNSFTGATTISSGTLSLSGSGGIASSSSVADSGTFDISATTSGASIKGLSGNGVVTLGGKTLTLTSASGTFSGKIAGSGALTISGSQTLSGSNSFTGATTIDGGAKLTLSGGGSIASSNVADSGTLDISGTTGGAGIKSLSGNGTVTLGAKTLTITSAAGTFSGTIGGSGGLAIAGGSETLTGTNSYSGGTTVSGTLILGASGAAGTGAITTTGSVVGYADGVTIANAIDINSNTTRLQVTTGTATQAGAIMETAGPRGLEKTGAGTLILTGNNSFTGATTISSGMLQLGDGGTAGAVAGNVVDNAVLVFDRSDAVAFGGAISGGGSLTQSGSGVLTVSGRNSYTGATTVAAGTLNVTGDISASSGVTVAKGATLTGTGSVAATTVQSGGTLSPGGGGIGTLTVAGNLTLAPGASTAMDLSPLAGDTIMVKGAADIAGTLTASFLGGVTYQPASYTLLTSTGAVSGTFNLDSQNLPNGYDASLKYGAHGVMLALTLQPNGFVWSANPASSDSNLAANWSMNVVPNANAVAEFDATSNANVVVARTIAIKALQFDKNAPAYSLAVTGTASGATSLTLSQGIVDASAHAPTVTVSGVDAGHAGTLAFTGAGNASDATIAAGKFGIVSFAGNTDAGAFASLVADAGGVIDFSATHGANGDGKISAGSIAGAGNIVLGANMLTVGALDDSTEVAGAISGTGGLIKTGGGTLTLSGTDTYTGVTTVESGALSVNGAIASNVVVAAGTLKGTGRTGNVTVASGATIAPGNSIGTLNTAAITFAPGAIYQAEVNASGQSDLINAGGDAALNGTVQAVEGAGSYAPVTIYRIVNAAGISGTFAGVTSSNPDFTPSLVYGATSVDLKLMRNDVQFGGFGTTPNQIAAGRAVTAGGAGSALYAAVANAYAPATINATLDGLSGEIQASLRSAMVEDSHVVRDALLDRLADPAMASGLWVQGFASSGWLDGDGNAARASRNYAGAMGGFDTLVDNLRLGLGGSVGNRKLGIADRASSASGTSASIFGYAGWRTDALTLALGGDYGWGGMHVARTVAGLAEQETSTRNGYTGEAFAQASYDLSFEAATFAPYVALDYVSATTDAFAESGRIAALSGDSATYARGYALVGARAALAGLDIGGLPLMPRAGLAWSHAFNDGAPDQNLAFKTGQGFTVLGTPVGMDAALVSLGLDLDVLPQLPISIGYDGSFSSRGQSHTLRGGVTWQF